MLTFQIWGFGMKTIKSLAEMSQQFDNCIELLDITQVGLWEMTPEGDVTFYNENFYKKFDIPMTDSTLNDWINIIHKDDQVMFESGVELHAESQEQSFKSEYRVIDRKSNVVWIEAHGIAQFNSSGEMIGMIGSHSDITAHKDYSKKLYDLAYIDQTTGIFNRKMLLATIQLDLRFERKSTLVIFDFFMSKQLISIYGQNKSDQIFKRGCEILKAIAPASSKLFRASTSKYALLLKGHVSYDEILKIVSHLKTDMSKISEAFNLRANPEFTTAALSYPLSEESLSANKIIDRAFLTVDDANRIQQGSISIYSDQTRERVLKSIHIETSLNQAVKHGELYTVYQPIISSKSKSIIGFEALVRWDSPVLGTIYPDEFIYAAEKNKSIVDLGKFVLKQALGFICEYNEAHNCSLGISVNVSVIELINSSYSEDVIALLEEFDVDPNLLTLEITESIMMDQSTSVTLQLQELKKHGVGVALDDFGTGYASLNSLINTPISEVKIDKEIMKELMSNKLIFSFMQSFVHLCHEHGSKVVAEGIESEAMIEKAAELKVDKLQGYLFSRPMVKEDALNFINLQ